MTDRQKKNAARKMFGEGASRTKVMRELGVEEWKARTWREEFSHCRHKDCGAKLLVPSGECKFCRDEREIAAGRMVEPKWWERAAA